MGGLSALFKKVVLILNWGDFKKSIVNLGFEEYDVFEENPRHIAEATNRANIQLHQIVEPNEKAFEYEMPETDEKFVRINLGEVIPGFLNKSNKAPRAEDEYIANYFYNEDTLHISSEVTGRVTIYYNAKLSQLDEDSPEDTELDCREDLIPFLQLLTAYYMWLDDDERKAIIYYNQFQEAYSVYVNSASSGRYSGDEALKASVIGGVEI